MRTGLVGAGAAIAVVGVGLVLSLFFLPGPPTNIQTATYTVSNLGPGLNATQTWRMSESISDSGTLALTWTSLKPVSVGLYRAGSCTLGGGLCPGQPIVQWISNVSGTWNGQGSVQSVYFLSVTNPGNTPVSFTGTMTEVYPVPTASSVVPAWALIAVGGLFLLGIGGTALFLGFFLASDVYIPPRTGYEPMEPGIDDGSELPPPPHGTDEY